ncbi:MAG: DegV family protein [Candidatus Izemoplasma sp.]
MSKIGLVVCGNSGIDYMDHDYDIEVFRSILFVGANEYKDFIDIDAKKFYGLLKADPSLTPTTAQTSTGVMVETLEKLRDKGYDEILVVTISNKLSGTYAGSMLAAKMVDGVKVTVFDSLSVAYPEAKMILRAGEMVAEGSNMEEIIKELEFIRNNHTLYVTVDTLNYLVKGGRISGASGFVGALLKIKPLLALTKDGRIESIEKIRTTAKATDNLIQKFIDETKGLDVEPYIVHAYPGERLDYVIKEILAAKPELKEIKVFPLTPVVGAHAGPGALALGYILNR